MALSDNCIHYWKFDGDATDSVGSNDGSVSAATLTTGKINQGYDFNGGSSYIDFGTNGDFSIGTGSGDTGFSISLWINIDSITRCRIISKGNTTTRDYAFYTGTGGTLTWQLWDGGSTNYIYVDAGSMSSYVGSWTHLVATYDGNNLNTGMKIYINGSEASVTRSSGGTYAGSTDSGLSFEIGRYLKTASYANAQIDEVGVWNREITSSEVTSLYNSGDGLQYPFGGSSGWTGTINGTSNPSKVSGIAVANISKINGI